MRRYDAFISYRHSEPDSEVAIALQKGLEHFSLPKNLRKQFPKDRWKIKRIFRDQDELPIAEDLSDQITEAIENSDFLITICTPRYPQSKWCAKEIELFKQMHGQDHILAVLAEGEPSESFPEGILYRDVKVTDEKGNEKLIREEVEPLAADVRGGSRAKRKRRINEEVVRLAAAMYGLPYDDVKQRHREQKIKLIASISSMCAGVFFVFALICMLLSMKINSQKEYIEQQHEELQEQYRLEQLKYAESMAMVSDVLLSEGRKKDAVYAARGAMPADKSDDEIPYTASTEYALSKALGKYEFNVYLPYDIEDVTKDEDFWGDASEYRYLESYIDGQSVFCAEKQDNGYVLIVTSACKLYYFDESSMTMMDATRTLFTDPPSGYLTNAAIKGDELYLWFIDADYVAVYRKENIPEDSIIGTLTQNELTERKGPIYNDGESFDSDDGRYTVTMGANHSVIISKASGGRPVKTLYDMISSYYALEKLGKRDEYILIGFGKYSYILDKDLDITARIPYYYGYDEDNDTVIVYSYVGAYKDYNLHAIPYADYDDLIEEADELLDGYKSPEEIMERYKMLK